MPRIIGMTMVGRSEGNKWLEPFLKHLQPLCDDIAICFNGSDKQTRRIGKRYAAKQYEDRREWGVAQPLMKEDFLARVGKELRPDWILWLDADEFLEKRFTRKVAEEWASKPYDVAYAFWFVQLWDRADRYLPNYSFDDVRFFKYLPQYGLKVKRTPLHCGNYPEVVANGQTHSDYYIKHYGLLRRKDRESKYKRYKKYDPKGQWFPQWFYDGYIQENSPTQPFIEKEFIKQIEGMKFRTKNPMPTSKFIDPNAPRKWWRWLNPHGDLIVFNKEEDHQRRVIARAETMGWKFLGEHVELEPEELGFPAFNRTTTPTPQPELVEDPFECQICGFIGKNKKSKEMHVRVKKHTALSETSTETPSLSQK